MEQLASESLLQILEGTNYSNKSTEIVLPDNGDDDEEANNMSDNDVMNILLVRVYC